MRATPLKANSCWLILLMLIGGQSLNAQSTLGDSLIYQNGQDSRYDTFYDSLKIRANQKKITRLLYDALFRSVPTEPQKAPEVVGYNPELEGKRVGEIKFMRLPVFGPTIRDTARVATSWVEKTGNLLHTRSDINNLRKNMVLKEGDEMTLEQLLENERLLRTMSRIRDARFIVIPDSLNSEIVNLLLITQDRFSIGATGLVDGTSSATAELYNRNFFGLGHEVSVSFVGHLNRQPYLGFETFYRINNLDGNFLSFALGYSNTYRKEGAILQFEKPLIRLNEKWGYGLHAHTYGRSTMLPELIRRYRELEFGFNQVNIWGARNFQIKPELIRNSQVTIAGQFIYRDFFKQPDVSPENQNYFASTNLYLAGITWSQRQFIRDQLIYGFGITEDIPKGFKYELVWGIDENKAGRRYYSQLFLSNGNLLRNHPGYLYLYAGAGSYFKENKLSQSHIQGGFNFISRLFEKPKGYYRHFMQVDYIIGLNRFGVETLAFEKNNLIRGFESRSTTGKERINFNYEAVYFQKRDFYRFNMAYFGFFDVGILGQGTQNIFQERYYTGIGAGLRLHNEALVLKTVLIRLAFYPKPPSDLGFVGLLIAEQTKKRFYNFQPGPPAPRPFQ